MVSKFMEISNIKKTCESNKKEIDDTNKIIKELEMKSINAEEAISGIKTDLEPM